MNRKILLTIFTILITFSLTGCSNTINQDKYTIEETIENPEDLSLDKILQNSPSTIDLSKKYQGTDLSSLILINYATQESKTLGELVDPNKPTVILETSMFCSACEKINYTNFLDLQKDINIFIITFSDIISDTEIAKAGLTNSLYVISTNKLISSFNDDIQTLEDPYRQIISGMGLPSCVFINKDKTFAFGTNGTKQANELIQYINFLE